jgi:N-methylhydantoinase A
MIDGVDLEAIAEGFHRLHLARFGYATPAAPVELINVRLSAVGRTQRPPAITPRESGGDARATGRRKTWSPAARALVDTPVYSGDDVPVGARIEGPAIVELANTTVVVLAGFNLTVDSSGAFVLYAPDREEWLLQRLAAGATAMQAAAQTRAAVR